MVSNSVKVDLQNLLCFDYCSETCMTDMPYYEQAAKLLSEQDPPRTLAKVDASANPDIIDAIQLKGVPTLYFFK